MGGWEIQSSKDGANSSSPIHSDHHLSTMSNPAAALPTA